MSNEKKKVQNNPEVSQLMEDTGLANNSLEDTVALFRQFLASGNVVSRTVIKETKVEEDGTLMVNQITANEVPKELKPIQEINLVSIIERAFVEKSKSRQIRYQLYVDKDKKIRRNDFNRACHTLAFLAEIMNHDAEIEIVDDFGETALVLPTSYKAPAGLVYNLVNFSNRVYINDYAKQARKWCSTTTVPAGYDKALIMRPDELETFLNHFNSEAKEGEKWESKQLTKTAVAYSDVAGGLYNDKKYINGKKFVKMNDVTTGITEAVVVLRGITFKGMEQHGKEEVPYSVNEYIKNALNAN